MLVVCFDSCSAHMASVPRRLDLQECNGLPASAFPWWIEAKVEE